MEADRFRRLIEPIHDAVLAFARGLCRSRSEGDDLFQEAVLRAFAKLDGLRDDASFRAWLYRIVVTVHRNRCRRAFWRRLLPFGGDASAPEDTDYRTSNWSAELAESSRRAREALATLPAVQREAIVLFEIEGWKVEEIADVQGVSVSAIKSRLARGRDRLREHYEQHPPVSTVGATT